MPAKKTTPETKSATPAPAKLAAEPTPAPVTIPVVEVEEGSTPVVADPFTVLEEKMNALAALFKEVQGQMRVVKKRMDTLRRDSEKTKRKRDNAKAAPNGFAKPTQISPELCEFLNVAKGTEKARTDVTREIHKFVQAKNLSDPANKRIILAHKDPVLKKLLGVTDKDTVTYFNLQRYLKKHFVKSVA
jgi:chromatin remodeling complex protein RSC6